MDINIGSILDETSKTADTFAALPGQISQVTQQLNDISALRQQDAQETAKAAGEIVSSDLVAKQSQEAMRKAIAARLGTDVTSAGWVIGEMADKMKVAKTNADAANAKIHAKESIGFLDNPLGFIAGQLTVKQDYADYNYWVGDYNNSEKFALSAAALTDAANQNAAAQTSTITQSYINAAKVVKAHEFNKEAYEAAAQGVRWNLEGIKLASEASRDRLQLLYSANTAMNQERNYKLEVDRLNLSRESFNLSKRAADEKLSEDSLVLRYVQNGFFNLTGKQMDPVRAKDAVMLFKAKQPDILAYFQNGLESANIGGKPVISLSPYDASTLIATNKVQNLSPDQRLIADQLVTWRREFESPAVQNASQLLGKDKTAQERAFNQYVEEKRKLTLGNLTQDSVFAPAKMKQVASINKTIQNLPLWKNVLEPASNTSVDIDDPNIAFGVVTSALQSGKISYADAADLSLIYAAGLDVNNQSKNLLAFGLAPVKTYNTQVSMPDQIGKTTINLADARAVAMALNKVSAHTAAQIINRRAGSPFLNN